MSALGFCVRQAATGLWRQRSSTILSVLTIAMALLVLGAFLAVSFNLNRAVSRWSAAAEFTVYLRDDITPDQRVAVNRLLADSPLVADRRYVSKSDALQRFARDFPDLAASAASLEQNPLPASVEVRLQPARASADAVEVLAAQAAAAAGVADVRFDRQWLARLSAIASAVGWAGWVLGGVLILAAALTVSTVVRLSLFARRDEVDILQLMGAPVALLRGPLVVEGVLHGGLGALLAAGALYGAHAALRARLALVWPGAIESGLLEFLPSTMGLALVLGGMAVGCAGGLVAARHVR
jgi:cell division transport system permease protein